MKNLTNSFLAAAALVAAAGSASAQTTLKAEIPFAFRVGDAKMAPGTYQVVINRGVVSGPIIHLRNETEHKTALVMFQLGDVSKEWLKASRPKIAFECYDGNCSLSQVWTATSRDAMYIRVRRPAAYDNAKLGIITLDLKAE